MICPRDQQALQESQSEGYTLHFCPQCHGVLVRLNQKSLPDLSNFVLKPDQRPKIQVPEHELCLSPSTGKAMLAIKHKGVIIDYCPESNSVWLDVGELEKISSTTLSSSSKSGASGKNKQSNSDDWLTVESGELAGVVAEFAFQAVVAVFTAW